MKWRRPPEKLVDQFLDLVPDDPGVEVRRMFGCPCFFWGGNMFAGIHQENLFVRLGDDQRAALLALPGAHQFEPMPDRPMREYVCVPQAMLADGTALGAWLATALDYARTLPPKQKKPRAAGKPPANRR